MEAPDVVIDAQTGPRVVLERIDDLEEQIVEPGLDEEERYRLRKELLNLWRALASYCMFLRTLAVVPPIEKTVFVKNLPADVRITHGALHCRFPGRI